MDKKIICRLVSLNEASPMAKLICKNLQGQATPVKIIKDFPKAVFHVPSMSAKKTKKKPHGIWIKPNKRI